MSKTYITEEKYNETFETLVKNLTDKTIYQQEQRPYDRLTYGKIGASDIIQKAARHGFLYDMNGNQIWNIVKDEVSLYYDEEKTGRRYLHYGDKTYMIYSDLHNNDLEQVEPDAPKTLKPLAADDPMMPTFTCTVPKDEHLVYVDREERPPMPNKFWQGLDAVIRFFTSDSFGLPSMNKIREFDKRKAARPTFYEDQLKCKEMQETMNARYQDSKAPKRFVLPGEKKEKRRNLLMGMRRYAQDPNVPEALRVSCASLNDAFGNLCIERGDDILTDPELDRISDELSNYFVPEGKPQNDPEKLLTGLKGCSVSLLEKSLKHAAINKLSTPLFLTAMKAQSVRSAVMNDRDPTKLMPDHRKTLLEDMKWYSRNPAYSDNHRTTCADLRTAYIGLCNDKGPNKLSDEQLDDICNKLAVYFTDDDKLRQDPSNLLDCLKGCTPLLMEKGLKRAFRQNLPITDVLTSMKSQDVRKQVSQEPVYQPGI